VEIATLDGNKLALTIPPETQNRQVFRLRVKGMPKIKKSKERGDLVAEIQVVLPQDLSERERELFQELDRARKAAPAETV
jgi:DnaJ-class molecular chaperone